MQPIWGGGVKVAVAVFKFNTHSFKHFEVHIDFTGTDFTATRHRNACATKTTHERTQHRNASAHLRNKLVGRIVAFGMLSIDNERMAIPFNRCAQAANYVVHDLNIGDMGNVVERALTLAQHCCCNELQRGILGTADLYRT